MRRDRGMVNRNEARGDRPRPWTRKMKPSVSSPAEPEGRRVLDGRGEMGTNPYASSYTSLDGGDHALTRDHFSGRRSRDRGERGWTGSMGGG